MGLLTFKGGIHPNDGKSLAKDQPIKDVIPTGKMIYPLSQHIGAPATAVVAKGDAVLKGQKIAKQVDLFQRQSIHLYQVKCLH